MKLKILKKFSCEGGDRAVAREEAQLKTVFGFACLLVMKDRRHSHLNANRKEPAGERSWIWDKVYLTVSKFLALKELTANKGTSPTYQVLC